MKPSSQVPPQELVESMKDEIMQYVKGVMEAGQPSPGWRVARWQRRTRA